jgi:hypothetical protein
VSGVSTEEVYARLDEEGELGAVWAVPVLAGLKPAGKCATSDRTVARRIEVLLLDAGLNVRRQTCGRRESSLLLFSRDADALTGLVQALLRRDKSSEGRLLGYPGTAVEAFVTGALTPYSAEPREMNEEWAMHFRLSRENWREEVTVLKSWNDDASRRVPGLFKRCVEWVRAIEFRRTRLQSNSSAVLEP